MTTDRSFPKYLLTAVLVMVLFCGFASMPIAAANPDSLCVELGGDIGISQNLYLNGVCITDCGGNQFALNDPWCLDVLYGSCIGAKAVAVIDLSGSGLNHNKPFKEVKLHLTLEREWGISGIYERRDKFTLDVTDLVTKEKGKPYSVLLKAYNSYQVGKADAVTIYDRNKNALKHFSPTHKDGHYGSWDYSSMDRLSLLDWVCVELDGDIGQWQEVYLNGVYITDCDGNQFQKKFVLRASNPNKFKGYLDCFCGKVFAKIDLSGSGLTRDKPFKEVKLHLTLKRKWTYHSGCKRWDMFTLDVTDLITKTEDKPNTVLLKAYNSYQVDKADAVTIYDCNGNKLKHFSPTHDDGCYCSGDYLDVFCAELDGDIGINQDLYINDVCITDCDGNQFQKKFGNELFADIFADIYLDLSCLGLNCDKPFKEVKLHLTLERDWGFTNACKRWDKFTLDVSNLITKTEDKPNTVLLKAYNSYQVGKADAVTIYDCNGNKLKHFSPTHKEGHYGSWD